MEEALKAKDVLDEFLYHLYSVKRRSGITGFLHKIVIFMWKRYETVQKFKEMNHEIKEIAERSKIYDLRHMEEDHNSHHSINNAHNIRETAFFVGGAELVRIDEESD
ncbi:hypothetical protein ACS0TY_011787 [Phlomoides rotata]